MPNSILLLHMSTTHVTCLSVLFFSSVDLIGRVIQCKRVYTQKWLTTGFHFTLHCSVRYKGQQTCYINE